MCWWNRTMSFWKIIPFEYNDIKICNGKIRDKLNNMKKFKRSEEKVVGHILNCSHNKDVIQHILTTIGKENWSKSILSNCRLSYLTEEQKELSLSLGRGFSFDEMVDKGVNLVLNRQIIEKLKEMGVSKYLYENDDYIDDIRNKVIICEGIDIDEIMNVEDVKK